jgi:hypothetical protein
MTIIALLLALGQAENAERVWVDAATGEVTLAGRNSVLREHADPSKFDVVTEMIVYKGRLLAACCMDFDETSIYPAAAYSTEAQLFEYSVEKDEWTLLRDFGQSMVFNMRVSGDVLMVPEYFPFNDRSRFIHAFDGREWRDIGPLEREAWHIMDVLKTADALYASGSWRDLDPDARKNDPNWVKGYGHVFASRDDGKTWTDLRRTREVGRCLDLVEFRGRIYCNERGFQLIAWDGNRWEEIPVRFDTSKIDAKLGGAKLEVFADRIVAANAELYYAYDGKAWKSYQPGFIDLWREGTRLYGLRKDGTVHATEDAVKWTAITKEGAPAREFDRQAAKGRPIHRGALALHRGRLFVGTSAEGRIYAAPYEEKGSFASKPEKFEAGVKLALAWEATGAVKMRMRSGETPDDLAKAAWKEAPASPAALPLPRKHSWAQWRADLESDGRRTPVIRSIRWTRD